jgi:D-hexose-6-phosphate mutarotase
MTAQATGRETSFAGLPAVELALPQGDTLRVTLHGAQVLSWISGGQERLYFSPQSTMDGQAAMRGGVPVCFPQFNQRGPQAERLPKHGFARHLTWQADAPVLSADSAQLCLHLQDNARTRACVSFGPRGVSASTGAAGATARAASTARASTSTFSTMPGPPPAGVSSTLRCRSVAKSRN